MLLLLLSCDGHLSPCWICNPGLSHGCWWEVLGTEVVTGKVECMCCRNGGSRAGPGFNGTSGANGSSCYLVQPDFKRLENHPQPMKGLTLGAVMFLCLVVRPCLSQQSKCLPHWGRPWQKLIGMQETCLSSHLPLTSTALPDTCSHTFSLRKKKKEKDIIKWYISFCWIH